MTTLAIQLQAIDDYYKPDDDDGIPAMKDTVELVYEDDNPSTPGNEENRHNDGWYLIWRNHLTGSTRWAKEKHLIDSDGDPS